MCLFLSNSFNCHSIVTIHYPFIVIIANGTVKLASIATITRARTVTARGKFGWWLESREGHSYMVSENYFEFVNILCQATARVHVFAALQIGECVYTIISRVEDLY